MAPPTGDSPPVLIVNPVSGGQRFAERWLDVERILVERIRHYEVWRTRASGDATTLAREALDRGARLVISVGGDGTHAQVARAFFDEDGRAVERYAHAAMGLLPLGRGNDLARALGLPRDPHRALAALDRPARAVDVVWVRWGGVPPRLVVNAASIGASALAVVVAARLPAWLGGTLRYALAGAWAALVTPRVALEIECGHGGPRYAMTPVLVACCNGSTFGGGLRVAPLARPDDGALEVVAIARGRLGALALAPRLFVGRHLGRPGVTGFSAARIAIALAPSASSRTVELECDGEHLGAVAPPIEVDLAPGALRIAGA